MLSAFVFPLLYSIKSGHLDGVRKIAIGERYAQRAECLMYHLMRTAYEALMAQQRICVWESGKEDADPVIDSGVGMVFSRHRAVLPWSVLNVLLPPSGAIRLWMKPLFRSDIRSNAL